MTTRACLRLVAAAAALFTPLGAAAQELRTQAERQEFDGPTMYGPLLEFVDELDARSDLMSVQTITQTLLGQDVLLCVLAQPAVRRPEDAMHAGRPVVLIVNNVHGGEVAGKDASLMLMRDLLFGELRPLLDQVTVLVVPNINPDGSEARRRTNQQGFDLNRDYLKHESQEIGALVTRVIHRWQPHVHVDTHHGGSAPYTLVYQTCMNPAGDAELVRYGNEHILPAVREALRGEDYDGYWYSGPRRRDDAWSWHPTSVEPRKQHVYSTLANMFGFLFESPPSSHRVVDGGQRVVAIPRSERYRHQVRGQYLGLRAVLEFTAREADTVLAKIADAKRRATAAGAAVDDEDDLLVLDYEQTARFQDEFWVRDNDSRDNAGFARTRGAVMTRFVPTKTTRRPWGYLLPPQMAKVVPLLLDHAISVQRLSQPLTTDVEAMVATEVSERQYYQGHYLKRVVTSVRQREQTFPAGSFFVPMAQPHGNLIGYLLEPETDDSLATWNHLDDFLRVRAPQPAAEDGQSGDPGGASRRARRGFRRGGPQTVPTYRVMQPIEIRGRLVERADVPLRRR